MPLNNNFPIGVTAESGNSSNRLATTAFTQQTLADTVAIIKAGVSPSHDTLAKLEAFIESLNVTEDKSAAFAIALG